MSAFKDMVAADVHSVFLNLSEFSDIHTVNGRDMPVQIDNNEQVNREKRQVGGDGVYRNQKLLYVSAADYGALPRQGSAIKLDGKTYICVDAVDEDGVYSITLEANKAR